MTLACARVACRVAQAPAAHCKLRCPLPINAPVAVLPSKPPERLARHACKHVTGQCCRNINIAGELLVIDAGSLIYTEDNRYVVTSVSDCEGFCEITPGCQAYVYCNNPNGCGYCSSYMEEYGNGG
jgi:hypothetical protein